MMFVETNIIACDDVAVVIFPDAKFMLIYNGISIYTKLDICSSVCFT